MQDNDSVSFLTHPVVITTLFILVTAVIAAFFRGRKRDKCLKAFDGYMVILKDLTGKDIWGKLRVETTGLELKYTAPHSDTDGHIETSFIFYKYEYGNISKLVRYHDQLDEKLTEKRMIELKRTYHPNWWRRFRRKIMNIFRTIRDSILEVTNVMMAQAKKTTVAGGVMTAQDKYISQMKNEIVGSVETSYEPLLEKHIGKLVVAEFLEDDKTIELAGVLKDYTPEFIELLDVQIGAVDSDIKKAADILLPRKRAIIRHLAE